MSPLGMLLGLFAGSGAWIAVAWSPPSRTPRFDDRLAPYLRDAPRPSRLLGRTASRSPFPTVERLVWPWLVDAARVVDRWVGGAASVRRRLAAAGRRTTVEEFRTEQVAWAAGGLAAGLGLGLLAVLAGRRPAPVPLLLLCAAFAVGGLLARDRLLTVEVARREARLLAELPAVAELLALAVAAGESLAAALDRVVRRAGGELARDLRGVLHDARAGAGLVPALDALAARTSLPALARFLDGLTVALERGTPLADVLRAQAEDARTAGRRALLESAGRREIAMLVPVVFLVLPVTVVFALFPGFYGLRVLAP